MDPQVNQAQEQPWFITALQELKAMMKSQRLPITPEGVEQTLVTPMQRL